MGVDDLGEPDGSCSMCGNTGVRYLHHMSHPAHPGLSVGCVCAGKMEGDYVRAKEREAKFVNKATMRARWLGRKWRTSLKGNPFINADGLNIGVHRNGTSWGWRVAGTFGPKRYATEDEAKLALFEEFWRRTRS